MSFSVVMSNWNRGDVLPISVRSILMQQGIENLEIIIVDDASSDDSLQKAVELRRKHPDIIRVFETHKSLTHNICLPANIGFKRAKYEYIVINPSDTIQLLPTNFREHLNLLRSKPKIISLPHLYNLLNWDHTISATAGSCLRREHILKVTGYDERMHGWGANEPDLSNRLGIIGVKIAQGECNAWVLHATVKLTPPIERRPVEHYNDTISAENHSTMTYAPNKTWGEHPTLEECL